MTARELQLNPIGSAIALTPAEVVGNATVQAKVLMDIVNQTHCFQVISGKKYLQVEAWETIGAFNTVHAVTDSVTAIVRDGATVGYDAKVNLINRDDHVVGGAIMSCYFSENACKGKEGDAKDKACKSAAQTFATSKAYRMNYSYVAILAGYEPTPAEEMGTDSEKPQQDNPTPTEHFCKEHNTKFFMAGNMRSFAHPVKDATGNEVKDDKGKTVWCHEHKDEKAPPPVQTSSGPPIDPAFDELKSETEKTTETASASTSMTKETRQALIAVGDLGPAIKAAGISLNGRPVFDLSDEEGRLILSKVPAKK